MYSTYNGGEVWKKKRKRTGDLEAAPIGMLTCGCREIRLLNKQFLYRHDAMGNGRSIAIAQKVYSGQQVYDDPDKYGNIYDHFACV